MPERWGNPTLRQSKFFSSVEKKQRNALACTSKPGADLILHQGLIRQIRGIRPIRSTNGFNLSDCTRRQGAAARTIRRVNPLYLSLMARILRKSTDAPQRSLWQRIVDIAMLDVTTLARGGTIAGSLEKLEEVLIEADFGVTTSMRLVEEVERKAKRGDVRTQDDFLRALEDGVATALGADGDDTSMKFAASGPTVVLVIGVNGAGKTTFIGKLAALMQARGKSVLVGAADTFRAGAVDQLQRWAERSGAAFIGARAGSDPASVAFNAIDAGINRGSDVVIIDTAGRLHTSSGLMDELRKIHRVIARRIPGGPHETLLVLDATIGQNALAQARTFADVIPVTGLVMTKLDGTARGGIVLAVREALGVPVKFIGTGETMADIEPFNPVAFAAELVEG